MRKIKVTAGSDAFEFLRAKRECKKNIDRCFGIMGEFVWFLPILLQGGAR